LEGVLILEHVRQEEEMNFEGNARKLLDLPVKA
jgi:hypothetical protein